jgi:hypothetical protein
MTEPKLSGCDACDTSGKLMIENSKLAIEQETVCHVCRGSGMIAIPVPRMQQIRIQLEGYRQDKKEDGKEESWRDLYIWDVDVLLRHMDTLRDVVEEMALDAYPDSNIESLFKTLQTRARTALDKLAGDHVGKWIDDER